MAKYRNKTGPYIKLILTSEQVNSVENHKLDNELTQFFHRIGYCVLSDCCSSKLSNLRLSAYHVAGVSIGIEAHSCEDSSYRQFRDQGFATVPQHYITMTLISNISLEGLLRKIKGRFSVFKELDQTDEA